MNDTNKKAETLEAALLQAGRSIAPTPPHGAWQANVMRAVRQVGPLPAAKASDAVVWGLVWKVAWPAAACAAVLCIVVHMTALTGNNMAQDADVDDSVEYALATAF